MQAMRTHVSEMSQQLSAALSRRYRTSWISSKSTSRNRPAADACRSLQTFVPREEEEESVYCFDDRHDGVIPSSSSCSFWSSLRANMILHAACHCPNIKESFRSVIGLAERDALAAELSATQAALAEAIARLEVIEPELCVLREENEILQQRVVALTQQVLALQERVRELEAELERLRQPDPLEAYINQSLEARQRLLEALQVRLAEDFLIFRPVLSEESDALRFEGDGCSVAVLLT